MEEEKKYIYPEVKILLEAEMAPRRTSLSLETYIRLVKRKKYYLCKVYKSFEIKAGINRKLDIITSIEHFYSEVYRCQMLMKVDPRIVFPQYDPPRLVFELDPDQRTEQQRLLGVDINANPEY
jgi:hypothetical protein